MQHPWNVASFGEFLGPFSPIFDPILLKFWPEVISDKAKQRQFMTNLPKFCLIISGTYPKFTVLVYFFGWTKFYPLKTQILLKVKTFQKTTSSGISNDTSPMPQNFFQIMFFVIKNSFSENFQQKHYRTKWGHTQFQNFPIADKKFTKSFLFFWKLSGRFSANYISFFGAMTYSK